MRVIFVIALTLHLAVGCPSGWDVSITGKCIKVFNFATSFDGATEFCRMFGGTMMSIHSGFENTEINNLAKKVAPGKALWIGLSTEYSNTYYWQDGTPMTYQNFKPGYPITKAKSCVSMEARRSQWTNEYDCNDENAAAYGCEIGVGDLPTTTTWRPWQTTTTTPCPWYNPNCDCPSWDPYCHTGEPTTEETSETSSSPCPWYNPNCDCPYYDPYCHTGEMTTEEPMWTSASPCPSYDPNCDCPYYDPYCHTGEATTEASTACPWYDPNCDCPPWDPECHSFSTATASTTQETAWSTDWWYPKIAVKKEYERAKKAILRLTARRNANKE